MHPLIKTCFGSLVALTTTVAISAPNEAYRIRRSVALPSTTAQGGGWSLRATLGQHDAGAHTGGGFRLNGGFWPGRLSDRIFRDGFQQ
ncbi:MAG: hypothetical protein JNN30_05460 [Rhodanobacteraceae bacterium]|nr:hypothetical protein [Rhodanobacteraceae bacterium]